MADNIKVVVKVRPLIQREIEEDLIPLWRVSANSIFQVNHSGKDVPGSQFTYDKVYGENTETSQLYDEVVKPIVEDATKGINGTIFAYGQTASGKTYTMLGDHNNLGITPLAVYNIFERIQAMSDRDFLLRVSYVEIYNDNILDLLSTKTNVKISETHDGIKIDAEERNPCSPEEVLAILKQGEINRQYGATNMNERSSRSHTIFQISIESKSHDQGDGCVNVSQLNLVDLAGSERSGQTGATGQRFKEGTHINKSLYCLGLVIKQLSEDAKYVNYRDSKLTRILQNSLGGNAKTSIICAITPATVDETLSTLQFANRAKAVKNEPKVNAVATDITKMQELTDRIGQLQYELENKKHVEEENQRLSKSIEALKKKIINNTQIQKSKKEAFNRRQTWAAPRFVASDDPFLHRPPSTGLRLPLPVDIDKEHLRTPPATRKPKSGLADIIEIDDSDEEKEASDTNCSPHHKCYTNPVPPCILKQRTKDLAKEYSELLQMTELEKIYTPEKADLLLDLDKYKNELTNLRSENSEKQREIELLQSKLAAKEVDLLLDLDKYKNELINIRSENTEKQREIELLQSKLAANEIDAMNFKEKIVELEIELESIKNKSKQRETELLSRLEERTSIEKLDVSAKATETPNQVKKMLDMSRDPDASLIVIENECDKISSYEELLMELSKKDEIIADIEQKYLCSLQKAEILQQDCFKYSEQLDRSVSENREVLKNNKQLCEEIEHLQNNIDQLNIKLATYSADIKSYQGLLSEQKRIMQPLKELTAAKLNNQDILRLENESKSCEICIQKQLEINQYKEQLKMVTRTANILEKENLKSITCDKKQLNSFCDSDIKIKNQEVALLKSDVRNLTLSCKELKNILNLTKDDCFELKERSKEELAKLNDVINNTYWNKIGELKAQYEIITQTDPKLDNENKSCEICIQKQLQINQYNEQVKMLLGNTTVLEKENENLKVSKINDIELLISAHNSALSSKDQELTKLNSNNNYLIHQYKELKNALNVTKQDCFKLIQSSKDDFTNLNDKITHVYWKKDQTQYDMLTQDRLRLEKENKEFELEIKRYEEEFKIMVQTTNALKTENENFKTSLERKGNEIEQAVAAHNAVLEIKNQELEKMNSNHMHLKQCFRDLKNIFNITKQDWLQFVDSSKYDAERLGNVIINTHCKYTNDLRELRTQYEVISSHKSALEIKLNHFESDQRNLHEEENVQKRTVIKEQELKQNDIQVQELNEYIENVKICIRKIVENTKFKEFVEKNNIATNQPLQEINTIPLYIDHLTQVADLSKENLILNSKNLKSRLVESQDELSELQHKFEQRDAELVGQVKHLSAIYSVASDELQRTIDENVFLKTFISDLKEMLGLNSDTSLKQLKDIYANIKIRSHITDQLISDACDRFKHIFKTESVRTYFTCDFNDLDENYAIIPEMWLPRQSELFHLLEDFIIKSADWSKVLEMERLTDELCQCREKLKVAESCSKNNELTAIKDFVLFELSEVLKLSTASKTMENIEGMQSDMEYISSIISSLKEYIKSLKQTSNKDNKEEVINLKQYKAEFDEPSQHLKNLQLEIDDMVKFNDFLASEICEVFKLSNIMIPNDYLSLQKDHKEMSRMFNSLKDYIISRPGSSLINEKNLLQKQTQTHNETPNNEHVSKTHNDDMYCSHHCVSDINALQINLDNVTRAHETLQKDYNEAKKEIYSLILLIEELERRIKMHRTNLSILTSTTYAENRLLESKKKYIHYQFNRQQKVFRKEIMGIVSPLKDLYRRIELEHAADQQKEAQTKAAYSTLIGGSGQSTSSANSTFDSSVKEFANESTLPCDMLMLDNDFTLESDCSTDTLKPNSPEVYLEKTGILSIKNESIGCQINIGAHNEMINTSKEFIEVSVQTEPLDFRSTTIIPTDENVLCSPDQLKTITSNNENIQLKYAALSNKMLNATVERKVLKESTDSVQSYSCMLCMEKEKLISELKDNMTNYNIDMLASQTMSKSEENIYTEWQEITGASTDIDIKTNRIDVNKVNNVLVASQEDLHIVSDITASKKIFKSEENIRCELMDSSTQVDTRRRKTVDNIHNILMASQEDLKKISDEISGIDDLTMRKSEYNSKECTPERCLKCETIESECIEQLEIIDMLNSRLSDLQKQLGDFNLIKLQLFEYIKENVDSELDILVDGSCLDIVKHFYLNIVSKHTSQLENLNNVLISNQELNKSLTNEIAVLKNELEYAFGNQLTGKRQLNDFIRQIAKNQLGLSLPQEINTESVSLLLEGLASKIKDLNDSVIVLELSNKSNEADLIKMKMQCNDLENINKDIKNKLDNTEQIKNELNNLLFNYKNDLCEKSKQLEIVETSYDQLKLEHMNMSSELETHKLQLNEEILSRQEMEKSYDSQISSLKDRNTDLSLKVIEFDKLTNEFNSLKQLYDSSNAYYAEIQKKYEKIQLELETVMKNQSETGKSSINEIKILNDANTELSVKHQTICEKMKFLEERLEYITCKIIKEKDEFRKSHNLADSDSITSENENKIDQLCAVIRTVIRDKNLVVKKLLEKQECCEKLYLEEITIKRQTIEDLENEYKSQLSQLKQTNSELTNNLNVLRDQLKTCETRFDELASELLTEKNNFKTAYKIRSADNFDVKKDKIDNLRCIIKLVLDDRDTVLKECLSSLNQTENLKSAFDILVKESNSFKDMLKSAELKLEENNEIISKQKERISSLQTYQNKLEDQCKSKDDKIHSLEKAVEKDLKNSEIACGEELNKMKQKLMEKTAECLALENSNKTHQKSSEHILKVIERTKQEKNMIESQISEKEELIKVNNETIKGLENKLTIKEFELSNLKVLHEMLEKRLLSCTCDGSNSRGSATPGRNSSGMVTRRHRRIMHSNGPNVDEESFEAMNDQENDSEEAFAKCVTSAICKEREFEEECVKRSSLEFQSPTMLARSSPAPDSTRKSIEMFRNKRRSMHDLSRTVSSDIPFNENTIKDNGNEIELRERLRLLKIEYMALEQKNKELDDECEMCGEVLQKRDGQIVRLYAEKDRLAAKLREMEKHACDESFANNTTMRLRSQMRDAATNTNPCLTIVGIDEQTYEFEKEKNRKLRQTIVDLKSKINDQNTELRRLQNTIKSNENILALTKDETDAKYKALKEEIEMYKTRIQELSTQLEQKNIECQASVYAGSGSGIVERANISEFIRENYKLKKLNEKLTKLYKEQKKKLLEYKESTSED